MKVAFYTLGCKVNQYETQILSQMFSAQGYEVVPHTDAADLYVINSCTVTAESDRKVRQTLRRLKSRNPQAKIALTGCFVQAFPDAAQQLPQADILAGARARGELLALVQKAFATGERQIDIRAHERDEVFEPMKADSFSERTRAFVKIQDGCERYCAYCIIPSARGPIRSKPLDALRAELDALAQNGYLEVVLVGINLSCYGLDLGCRLIDAVELACNIPGIQRVRLGSLEPELLDEETIRRMAALPALCGQFHLSLQSGCDRTLGAMRRHYTAAQYTQIVRDLRTHFENCAITTDIMVGFPGETEADFSQSLAFAAETGFAKVHVFAYSRRPGTVAADMPDQVQNAVKEERVRAMIAATAQTRQTFLQAQIGRREQVLFEQRDADGYFAGYTQNYTPVRVPSPERDLRGQLLPVVITGAQDEECTAML